jgi:hypothetical protein
MYMTRGSSFCLACAKTIDIIQRQTRIACVFTQLFRSAVFCCGLSGSIFQGSWNSADSLRWHPNIQFGCWHQS